MEKYRETLLTISKEYAIIIKLSHKGQHHESTGHFKKSEIFLKKALTSEAKCGRMVNAAEQRRLHLEN